MGIKQFELILQAGQQVSHQFDALRFPPAQGRTGLSKFQIIQAGIAQCLQGTQNPGVRLEKEDGLFDRQFEHLYQWLDHSERLETETRRA